jgi:hypothetical protein
MRSPGAPRAHIGYLRRASHSLNRRWRAPSCCFDSAILALIFRNGKPELAAVKSHPVHDHGKLARDRNDGALVPRLATIHDVLFVQRRLRSVR